MTGYMHQPEKIKPPALVDEQLQIYDEGTWKYYKVTFIEPILPFQKDFGSLAAGKTTGDKDVEELKLGAGWCALVRIYQVDDLQVTVKQPKAKTRFVVGEKITTFLTALVEQLGLRHLAELTVLEDKIPIVDIKNPTKYNIAKSRLVFYGIKMEIEKLPTKPEKYTSLEATGK